MLVLGVLFAAGAVATVAGWYALDRWPSLDPGAPGGAVRAVGQAATGLALTLSVGVVIVGGGVLAVLALVTRSNAATLRIDRSVTNWAGTNATDLSTQVLKVVTQLGSSLVVISLAVVLVVVVAATTHDARKRTVLVAAG